MEGTRKRFQRTIKRIKRQRIKHIPQDIIDDILVNLPVKSLLRFKCVSKPWRSLISRKDFTKAHLNTSSHNLIYSSYDHERGGHILRSCSLKSFLDKQNYENQHPMVTTSYHDSFSANPVYVRAIVGSCNGLILIRSQSPDLILWNPSTRQVKIIPPPRKRYWTLDYFVYGFGYDDSNDDYKVVSILISRQGPYKTQMYSLRTKSWKKIENFEKGHLERCTGTHVNGKLHWLATQEGVGGNEDVVSLSLVDGKFDIVPLPQLFLERNRRDSNYILDNLGGYLSLVRQDGKSYVYFWVMMKYGEVESWTNRCIALNLSDPIMRPIKVSSPRPIWLTENGEVIVAISGLRFVFSNGKNKSQVYAVDTEIRLHYIYDQYGIYVESLVSP